MLHERSEEQQLPTLPLVGSQRVRPPLFVTLLLREGQLPPLRQVVDAYCLPELLGLGRRAGIPRRWGAVDLIDEFQDLFRQEVGQPPVRLNACVASRPDV